VETKVALRLEFPVTNNGAEYEALLYGLTLATTIGVGALEISGDSQLIISQVSDSAAYFATTTLKKKVKN
jgi:ribonuclease HI